ncbi:FecR family protein [Mesorhizobium marinum]|uniref:FecR family protein n=1 Tax=Mesorhizobium marinum TaxID=3228790 RepID=UPI0034664872
MKSLLKIAAAATPIFATTAFPALAQGQVGQATLIRTSVTGHGGPLAVRSPVYRDERIRTSQSGLGEFRFADGTKFAVGGNSSVVIDRFVYDSSKTFDKLSLNAARGSFRWISGKSKSEAYEIRTPAGTIGIRGTRLEIFIGTGGQTAVVLLSGAARFCGANGCEDLRRRCDVVVARPGSEIRTPAGTIGIRGTRLEIFIGTGGQTAVVLLSGAARFCGANGCEDLRRRCDVVVARPGSGVSPAARVNRDIFQELGTDAAFPFLTGRQRLSSGFQGFGSTSCGLSARAGLRGERGGGTPEPKGGFPSNGGNDGGGGCDGGCGCGPD